MERKRKPKIPIKFSCDLCDIYELDHEHTDRDCLITLFAKIQENKSQIKELENELDSAKRQIQEHESRIDTVEGVLRDHRL